MDAHTPSGRPRLSARVRLRWDEVRQRHVLLMPEKVIVLNETAAEILKLCDGSRTAGELVGELHSRYGGSEVADDVTAFLQQAAERGWLEWTPTA